MTSRPRLLYAVAWQESTWRQFTAAGAPLISGDGGIGIMQVTIDPRRRRRRPAQDRHRLQHRRRREHPRREVGLRAVGVRRHRRRRPALLRGLVLRRLGVQRPQSRQPVPVPDLGPHRGRPRTLDRPAGHAGREEPPRQRAAAEGRRGPDSAAGALVERHPAAQARAERAARAEARGGRRPVHRLRPALTRAPRRRALRRAARPSLERLRVGAPPHPPHDQPRRRRRDALGRHLRSGQDRSLEADGGGPPRRRPRRRDLQGRPSSPSSADARPAAGRRCRAACACPAVQYWYVSTNWSVPVAPPEA